MGRGMENKKSYLAVEIDCLRVHEFERLLPVSYHLDGVFYDGDFGKFIYHFREPLSNREVGKMVPKINNFGVRSFQFGASIEEAEKQAGSAR